MEECALPEMALTYHSYPDIARDIFPELDKLPEHLKNQKFLERVEEARQTVSTIITGRLYVSGEPNPTMAKQLVGQVTAVLTVDNKLPDPVVASIYAKAGIKHHRLLLDDDEKLPAKDVLRAMEVSYKNIDEWLRAKHKVLVHCSLGRSRSVTMVAYFLLRRLYEKHTQCDDKLKLPQILKQLRKIRPISRPNPGFEECLLRAETILRSELCNKE